MNDVDFQSLSAMEARATGLIHFHQAYRDAGTGELFTQEFWEHPVDGRSIKAHNPVGWEEKVPEGVRLHPSSGGCMPGSFQMFWVGWVEGATLKALAITQENPIAVAIEPGDRLLHPPVLGWDKKLKWYFLRKQGAGYALCKHEFSGELNQPGTVVTEKLIELPYEPLFPVAKPVPVDMENGFRDNGEAVLAWLSAEGTDLRAHALWIKGKTRDKAESDSVSGYRPFDRQRIDVWASGEGMVRVGWMMQRIDQDNVRAAEWVTDFRSQQAAILFHAKSLEASKLHSAATVLNRKERPGMSDSFLLGKSGTLYRLDESSFTRVRDQVPLDYDFPILSGYESFEARRDEKGGLYFLQPGY